MSPDVGTYFQDNFLHFLVGGLELSDQDQHHFPGVVVCVFCVHQRDQVTDSLQESGQTLHNNQHTCINHGTCLESILTTNVGHSRVTNKFHLSLTFIHINFVSYFFRRQYDVQRL